MNGIELGRRCDGVELYGLTTPLLTTADGQKMGKTVGGAIWLNEDMLPREQYWQFWRNTHDADVGRFLRLFTDLPIAEIVLLEQLQGKELEGTNTILANAATDLCRAATGTLASAVLPSVSGDRTRRG